MSINDIPVQLVPEVDLDRFHTPGSLLLIDPLPDDMTKTSGGIILANTIQGEEGVSTNTIRSNMIQRAIVIKAGSKCSELAEGDTIFYYKSSLNKGMVRAKDKVLFLMEEYDNRGFYKRVSVPSAGNITTLTPGQSVTTN